MPDHDTRVLAARWILPIDAAPIRGGWIRLRGSQVIEVGQGRPTQGATDLGDAALLPGLVNAHTHLEFSDLSAPIGTTGIGLPDWIAKVVAARQGATPQTVRRAIATGVRQSLQAGVRLIGEITTPPADYSPFEDTLPSIIPFTEVLGLSAARGEERMAAAIRHHRRSTSSGWSPHAPYSIAPELIRRCVEHAVRHGRPIAMHVAESPDERELLVSGGGALAETLKGLGVFVDGVFPWGDDPFVPLLRQLAAAPRALVIHGNDFRAHEIEVLGRFPNVTVVHCPRTHDFFGYRSHPLAEMAAAGVRVALGTDSRASNPDLDLWRDVQWLLNHRQDVDPHDVLQMATRNGADALGRADVGSIAVGRTPGFGSVATTATDIESVFRDLATGEFRLLSSPEGR